MRPSLPFLFYLLLWFIIHAFADDDFGINPCKDDGQCTQMMRSYEMLIEGDGCRPFFVTGRCPRICAFSLKSLISRRGWSRCARRCDWAVAVTDAASSWLHMCLARRADDEPEENDQKQQQHEDEKENTRPNSLTTAENSQKEETQQQSRKNEDFLHRVFHRAVNSHSNNNKSITMNKWMLFIIRIFVISLIIVSIYIGVISVQSGTPIQIVTKNIMNKTVSFLKQAQKRILLRSSASYRHRRSARRGGSGVLDGPLDRRDLSSSLSRGARRHLKSFRATNLD